MLFEAKSGAGIGADAPLLSAVTAREPAEEAEEPPGRPRANPRSLSLRPSVDSALSMRLPGAPTPVGARRPSGGERIPNYPINEQTDRFRRLYFPKASRRDWNDWRWQVRHRIRSQHALEGVFLLSAPERAFLDAHAGGLPVGITPYYASLMALDDASDPLRRTHLPVETEFLRLPGEAEDPLNEDHDTAVPGLVHRYPDRVLFLTTGFCSTYCRYCTRSRMVGGGGETVFSRSQWDQALAYIRAHEEIRDVLLSGGDPLTLAEDRLDWLLGELRAIPHVEFVRIGTKVPMVLPMRVTAALVRVLRRHKPWLSVHATHPTELTPESTEAFERLADAGLPLGSQTVLLRGINDEVDTLKRLFHGLLKRRVRPYYLYQCDPIKGSSHFRTPVEKGLAIMRGLRGHTTGYAVPTFVIDAPGGGGKIPLLPDPIVGRDGDDLLLRNFEGGVFRYPDPEGTLGRPVDSLLTGAK